MRPESQLERQTRHWLAQRSFYAECMDSRDGRVHLREVLYDLRDCDDPMEPELCERLRCRASATYATGARHVLDLHLTLAGPRGADTVRASRDAEALATGRAELLPAQL